MKKIRTLVAILLTLTVVFTLVACNNNSTPTSQSPASNSPAGGDSSPAGGDSTPAGGGAAEKPRVEITIGTSGWLGVFLAGLNPSASEFACSAVFDTIVYVDPATQKPFSRVLTDWGFKDDLTYYMELRDDVYFSNGDHATAEDLYFSYWNHPERGSNWLQNHGIIWDQSGPVSEYRVEFKLEKHYPSFDQTGIYLVDKKWSEEVGWDSMEWYNPVGTGPYYVYEYVNDSHIILRTRESIGQTFWNKDAGPLYVDQWTIKYYPDASALFMALQTGEVDYAGISATDYRRWVAEGRDPSYTCVNVQTGAVFYFMFGFQDSDIWFDRNLREAVAIGVNWQQVGEATMAETFIPARSIASTFNKDFVDLGFYEYNPDRARELMAGAGYGPDNPLQLYTVTDANSRTMYEAIQYFMSDIYIDATIDFADNAGAIAAWLAPGNTDFGTWGNFGGSRTGDLGRDLNEIRPFTGLTWSGLQDERILELYDIITGSGDLDEISKANVEIQHAIFDDFYYIPIYEMISCYGFRSDTFTEEQIANNRIGLAVDIGSLSYTSKW